MRSLSGGKRTAAVLARELSNDVSVSDRRPIPVFRARLRGGGGDSSRGFSPRAMPALRLLLVSEDLDELLELSDRIAVMFDGRLVHQTHCARTSTIGVIGRCMASSWRVQRGGPACSMDADS
jgi:simple sugar transport system ATP-binding protein